MLLVADAPETIVVEIATRHGVRGWAERDLNLGRTRSGQDCRGERKQVRKRATKQTSDGWKNNAVQVAIAKLRRRGSQKVDEARGRSLSRWCLGKGAEWRTGSRTFLFFFFGRMLRCCQGSQAGKSGLRMVGCVGGRGVQRGEKKKTLRGARREKKWVRVGVDAPVGRATLREM